MHTWGEYKIEKVSLLRIDANLTSIAKTFFYLAVLRYK